MLRRDGAYVRFPMAFRYGPSYAFQFEPQLTLDELRVWNRELAGDYDLMGDRFDPAEEAARNLREFEAFASHHEAQMARMLRSAAQPTQLKPYLRLRASDHSRYSPVPVDSPIPVIPDLIRNPGTPRCHQLP